MKKVIEKKSGKEKIKSFLGCFGVTVQGMISLLLAIVGLTYTWDYFGAGDFSQKTTSTVFNYLGLFSGWVVFIIIFILVWAFLAMIIRGERVNFLLMAAEASLVFLIITVFEIEKIGYGIPFILKFIFGIAVFLCFAIPLGAGFYYGKITKIKNLIIGVFLIGVAVLCFSIQILPRLLEK